MLSNPIGFALSQRELPHHPVLRQAMSFAAPGCDLQRDQRAFQDFARREVQGRCHGRFTCICGFRLLHDSPSLVATRVVERRCAEIIVAYKFSESSSTQEALPY